MSAPPRESGYRFSLRRASPQLAVHRFGLQEEAPLRALPVARLDNQARLDVGHHGRDDLVEEAARLARVARDVREAALVLVELLECRDRQVEIVLVEAEETRRARSLPADRD